MRRGLIDGVFQISMRTGWSIPEETALEGHHKSGAGYSNTTATPDQKIGW